MPDPLIDQKLYVGNIKDAYSNGKDFDVVINVCETETDNENHHFPLIDGEATVHNMLVFWDVLHVLQEEYEQLQGNEKILVHCHGGRSRSVSLCASFLALENEINIIEALNYIDQIRHTDNGWPKEGTLAIAAEVTQNERDQNVH